HGAGATAREAADAVLALVIADVTDRALSRVLTEIAAGVVQPRITSRDEQCWEDELFHIAAPRALRTEVFAPERVRETSARPVDGLELQPVRGAGARRRERRAIGATLAAVTGAAAERWRTIRAG